MTDVSQAARDLYEDIFLVAPREDCPAAERILKKIERALAPTPTADEGLATAWLYETTNSADGNLPFGKRRWVERVSLAKPDETMPWVRNVRPLAALRTPAPSVADELLREARDKGLIYWEPNTERGRAAKNDLLARIDAALSPNASAGEGE